MGVVTGGDEYGRRNRYGIVTGLALSQVWHCHRSGIVTGL